MLLKLRRAGLIAILVVAIQSASQGPPESLALLQRALEKSELRVGEAAPFRLIAEIQTRAADSKPQTGKYELVWISPERWREDIIVSGVKETRIGGPGKVWRFPGRSPETEGISMRARELAFREKLEAGAGDKISSPKERRVEGARLLCLKVKRAFEIEYCFDSTSGLLVRSKSGPRWVEFLDYKPAGNKLFPQRVVEGGREVVRILAIETNIQPDASLFDLPPGVAAEPGCQYPKFPKVVKMVDPEMPTGLRGGTAMAVVAGWVTVDGSIEDVRILRSGGPGADSAALKAVRQWKFQPATCDSTPVRYKIAIEIAFSGR